MSRRPLLKLPVGVFSGRSLVLELPIPQGGECFIVAPPWRVALYLQRARDTAGESGDCTDYADNDVILEAAALVVDRGRHCSAFGGSCQ